MSGESCVVIASSFCYAETELEDDGDNCCRLRAPLGGGIEEGCTSVAGVRGTDVGGE